ncbi:unnamed protein product [Ostreobium quekettii]|uniref:Uncharacterized protein n=1 Tax=Ostreobium quekettii TaxID=121088 RepID=A0A8S1ITS1_9CHLO|nr:unnamed protein product [Ostreobium quekettii]
MDPAVRGRREQKADCRDDGVDAPVPPLALNRLKTEARERTPGRSKKRKKSGRGNRPKKDGREGQAHGTAEGAAGDRRGRLGWCCCKPRVKPCSSKGRPEVRKPSRKFSAPLHRDSPGREGEEGLTVYYSATDLTDLREAFREMQEEGCLSGGGHVRTISALSPIASTHAPTGFRERVHEVVRKLSRGGSGRLGSPKNVITTPQGQLPAEAFARLCGYTGCWEMDRSRSDDYSSLVALMKLGWAFSKALDNSRHIELHVARDKIHVTAKLFNWVELRDARPWSGEKIATKRKDARRGGAIGWVERTSKGFMLRSEWGEPLAGNTSEEFELSDDRECLHVTKTTSLRSGGTSVVRVLFVRCG